MVVPDPPLEPGRMPGGLDSPHQAAVGTRRPHAVDGLHHGVVPAGRGIKHDATTVSRFLESVKN
jgi:hypothetical protein